MARSPRWPRPLARQLAEVASSHPRRTDTEAAGHETTHPTSTPLYPAGHGNPRGYRAHPPSPHTHQPRRCIGAPRDMSKQHTQRICTFEIVHAARQSNPEGAACCSDVTWPTTPAERQARAAASGLARVCFVRPQAKRRPSRWASLFPKSIPGRLVRDPPRLPSGCILRWMRVGSPPAEISGGSWRLGLPRALLKGTKISRHRFFRVK